MFTLLFGYELIISEKTGGPNKEVSGNFIDKKKNILQFEFSSKEEAKEKLYKLLEVLENVSSN